MNIVEEAVRRLEQLKQAGAELDEATLARVAEGGMPHPAESFGSVASLSPSEQVSTPQVNNHVSEVGSIHAGAVPRSQVSRGSVQRIAKRMNIDLKRLEAAGFVTPEAPRSQVADELRVIKRPLLANAKGKSATPVANGNRIQT